MMKRFSTIFCSIVVVAVAVTAFSACGSDKHLRKAEKYLALGEYFDAATEFKKAYQTTPPKERDKRGQRALKMAKCYAKINQTQAALAGYRNGIRRPSGIRPTAAENWRIQGGGAGISSRERLADGSWRMVPLVGREKQRKKIDGQGFADTKRS